MASVRESARNTPRRLFLEGSDLQAASGTTSQSPTPQDTNSDARECFSHIQYIKRMSERKNPATSQDSSNPSMDSLGRTHSQWPNTNMLVLPQSQSDPAHPGTNRRCRELCAKAPTKQEARGDRRSKTGPRESRTRETLRRQHLQRRSLSRDSSHRDWRRCPKRTRKTRRCSRNRPPMLQAWRGAPAGFHLPLLHERRKENQAPTSPSRNAPPSRGKTQEGQGTERGRGASSRPSDSHTASGSASQSSGESPRARASEKGERSAATCCQPSPGLLRTIKSPTLLANDASHSGVHLPTVAFGIRRQTSTLHNSQIPWYPRRQCNCRSPNWHRLRTRNRTRSCQSRVHMHIPSSSNNETLATSQLHTSHRQETLTMPSPPTQSLLPPEMPLNTAGQLTRPKQHRRTNQVVDHLPNASAPPPQPPCQAFSQLSLHDTLNQQAIHGSLPPAPQHPPMDPRLQPQQTESPRDV